MKGENWFLGICIFVAILCIGGLVYLGASVANTVKEEGLKSIFTEIWEGE